MDASSIVMQGIICRTAYMQAANFQQEIYSEPEKEGTEYVDYEDN